MTMKAARVNANLTQREAGALIGKSEETIRNYEKGKTFPDTQTIEKITEAYGVSYDDIIFLPIDNG